MRLTSLQMARAFACLLVCFYHLFALSRDYAQGIYYDPLMFGFTGGVDLFFVISGIVMVVTTNRRYGEAGTAARFAIHRVSRIYPPYWILAAVLTVYWLHNPAGVNAKHGGVDLFASFTLVPSKLLPILPVGWTLSYELMFYFVFWAFLVWVPKRRLPAALIGWSLFVLVGQVIAAIVPLEATGIQFMTSPFILEFIAGCAIGLAYLSGRLIAPASVLAFGVVAFCGVLFGLHVFGAPEGVPARVALLILPAAAIVYGMLGLEASGRLRFAPRVLVAVGNSSYSIYLIHILIVHAAYRYVFRFADGVYGMPFLVGTFMAAVLAGIAYNRAIERPTNAVARAILERLAGISAPAAKHA